VLPSWPIKNRAANSRTKDQGKMEDVLKLLVGIAAILSMLTISIPAEVD
jgi:hypothetical protein